MNSKTRRNPERVRGLANPFRVQLTFMFLIPGFSLRSNPGLKLANAFGVLANAFGVLANTFGVLANTFGVLANTFGVLANAFGVLANAFGVICAGNPFRLQGCYNHSRVAVDQRYPDPQRQKIKHTPLPVSRDLR